MNKDVQLLRLEQVQRRLDAYSPLASLPRPLQGWLKTVRSALGRTERQQAALVGMSGPALHKSEQSEADDRISLGQLRKLAGGLDCELVYALVPRRPLAEAVLERAHAIAVEEVHGVASSMGLEGQPPSARLIERQVKHRVAELLRGRWAALWRS